MKRTLLLIGLVAIFIGWATPTPAQSFRASKTALEVTLSAMPNVTSVQRLESADFAEKYEIHVRQEVNPGDIRYGFFDQRVFLMHVGPDRPTVLVTEGYGADYASRPRYREELSRLLNANLVVVEHRYFSHSVPMPRRWQYLSGENAMLDLHNVRQMFSTLYPGKWIATGISKGGQTALMYRTLYPDDVDITVSYVGPLCQDVEDGRHEPFIANQVGTKEAREKVLNFQKELLIRKDSLMVPFKAFCEKANLELTRPALEIYDYCVLEYSFAFWQWGTPVESIPPVSAPDSVLFSHFMRISSPDYFVKNSPNLSFFVQAARQLGYYGYDTKPFNFKVTRTRYIPDGPIKLYFSELKANRKKERLAAAEQTAQETPEKVATEKAGKRNKTSKAVKRDLKEQKRQEKELLKQAEADRMLAEQEKEKAGIQDSIPGKWVTRKFPALDIKSAKGYLKDLFLPDFYKPSFNKALYKKQSEFVKTTDAKLVFIYGEWDPWSAAAVPNPQKSNVIYCVQPGGSHSSRIGSLPEDMRDNLIKQLNAWLAE